jgi:hypothetical protein
MAGRLLSGSHRFLFVKFQRPSGAAGATDVVFVSNWADDLKRLVSRRIE